MSLQFNYGGYFAQNRVRIIYRKINVYCKKNLFRKIYIYLEPKNATIISTELFFSIVYKISAVFSFTIFLYLPYVVRCCIPRSYNS